MNCCTVLDATLRAILLNHSLYFFLLHTGRAPFSKLSNQLTRLLSVCATSSRGFCLCSRSRKVATDTCIERSLSTSCLPSAFNFVEDRGGFLDLSACQHRGKVVSLLLYQSRGACASLLISSRNHSGVTNHCWTETQLALAGRKWPSEVTNDTLSAGAKVVAHLHCHCQRSPYQSINSSIE